MKGVTQNSLYVTPGVTNKHISVTPEGLWISTPFFLSYNVFFMSHTDAPNMSHTDVFWIIFYKGPG